MRLTLTPKKRGVTLIPATTGQQDSVNLRISPEEKRGID
jgi:hypothetical protein